MERVIVQEYRSIRLGASILAADFLRLGEQIAEAESHGVDFIHFDVMDGRFVPNISIGLPVLEAVRGGTRLPIDVHLMIVEPERWVEPFIAAGADVLTVHVETCGHLHGTLRAIADTGATPSVALNPATPLASVEEVLPLVQQVLVMTVNPGFGGQTFIPGMLDKIHRLRAMLDERNPTCAIEVDGGIKASTAGRAVAAGADTLVAGSSVYGVDLDLGEALRTLRSAARQSDASS